MYLKSYFTIILSMLAIAISHAGIDKILSDDALQSKPDFGPFKKHVDLIIYYITDYNPTIKRLDLGIAQDNIELGLGADWDTPTYCDVSTNYKTWTEGDWEKVARNEEGYFFFELLFPIMKSASQMNKEKTEFTHLALQALNALDYLKPKNQTVNQFYDSIKKVFLYTETARKFNKIRAEKKEREEANKKKGIKK